MAKDLRMKTMATPKKGVLEDFSITAGIGTAAPQEITVTDEREKTGNAQSAGNEPGAESQPAAAMQMPPTPAARKQGAGRKKRLLIGARFREEDMGPTFEIVQEKVGKLLGVADGELSMQELMAAVVRATINDDEESVRWLAQSVLRERERSANEMKNALNL